MKVTFRTGLRVLSTVGLVAALVCVARPDTQPASGAEPIGGPYSALLRRSTDLGPATNDHVQVTAALRAPDSPHTLIEWAHRRNLSVRWRTGDNWAVLEGKATAVAAAFSLEVRRYLNRDARLFYASPQQPAVPPALDAEVSGFGRILSYTPHHEASPWPPPREVPDRGLSPDALLRAYNAVNLSRKVSGKGITVVIFSFDGFDQADLDQYSTAFGLPPFTPEVVGGIPEGRRGEATMNLEAIHAVAPGARKVLVNALPTLVGEGPYLKVASLMEDTYRRYPGAVWSLSIGWGCDRLLNNADLTPVRSVLSAAHRTGTTILDASGDLAGLECKDGDSWSGPPIPDEIGLDAVASLPEVTSVGGTTLSTDSSGRWIAERAWFDSPLTQGSGGGTSALFDRPPWQLVDSAETSGGRRLTPDVAAVADQFTGLKIVFDGQFTLGGGTSLSAPIMAGFTALMNEFLQKNGAGLLGDLNPLLYQIAADTSLQAFRDVTEGGNAVSLAGPGYDQVTGLGTPDVGNLAKNLFFLRKLNR